MKTSQVVGRKIVEVGQQKFWNEHTASWAVSLDWVKLDNGTFISFTACETEIEPYVHASICRPREGKAE